MKAEPDVLELADLDVILAPAQIDDVGYPKLPKPVGVPPGGNGAPER